MEHQRKKRTTITKEIISMVNNQIQAGKSNKEIAEILNISYNSIRNIGNKITKGEDDSTIIKKKGRRFNNDNVIISQLSGIISNNNGLTQKGMSEELLTFGIKKSQSTISKILTKAEITRKRLVRIPESRNSPRVITMRQQYALEIQYYSVAQLIYLDETGFNLHTTQHYGYSQKNTKAFVTVPSNRGINNSLMVAISVNGIIGWELIDGAFNGASFLNFISIHLIPYFANNPHSLLVMDNCRFHHRLDVLQLLNENRIAYNFLPPYTPDLNPIENFFSEIKAKYRAIIPSAKTRDELKANVNGIMQSHGRNFVGIYEHAKGLLSKALSRHPFI